MGHPCLLVYLLPCLPNNGRYTMTQMTIAEAIRQAIREEMRRDPTVF